MSKHFDFIKLWKKAKYSLSKCRTLLVIGYSFPATDFHTRKLFLEAFTNNIVSELIIVNHDSNSIEETKRKSIYLIAVSSLLSIPTTQIQELWIGYTSISPDNPQVGQIRVGGLTFSIILSNGQQNWIWTNVPSPNVSGEQWKIKSVKLRIRTRDSPFGGIDKVGIKDGENVVHEFNPLAITSFNNWNTISLEVPGPRSFKFGLGVSIHLNNRVDTKEDPPPPLPPVKIEFASIGVVFIK